MYTYVYVYMMSWTVFSRKFAILDTCRAPIRSSHVCVCIHAYIYVCACKPTYVYMYVYMYVMYTHDELSCLCKRNTLVPWHCTPHLWAGSRASNHDAPRYGYDSTPHLQWGLTMSVNLVKLKSRCTTLWLWQDSTPAVRFDQVIKLVTLWAIHHHWGWSWSSIAHALL